MIVRFPGRERDPGWQAEREVQPDPMLQENHSAGPVAIGLAAAFAVLVVGVLFYGLNQQRGPSTETIATGSSAAPPSTSGQAPASDANAPAPADKANTGTGAGQSSGQAQPANQGQGGAVPPGSGQNR
jgi:hypothetical protein